MVLGAGATRGAQFVDDGRDGSMQCLPPLNTDFFTQLQRIRTDRHQELVSGVVKDVIALFGSNFSLTLEEYFTQLEAMIRSVRLAGSPSKEFSVTALTAKRSRLLEALSAVLEESADVSKVKSIPRTTPCTYHQAIVESLHPRDTIISFNYDCVIDDALRRWGAGRWSAQYGYSLPRPGTLEGHEHWSAPRPPTRHNRSINLLKLHGSINWFPFPSSPDEPIRLRQRPYKQRGQKLYEIVPPEYVKDLNRPIYEDLWKHADLALRRAKVLAFIGFSFTPTDLHVESLFRIATVSNRSLRRVVIANPNQDHRRRIRSILAPGLRQGATVVQFETMQEAAPRLKELLKP